MDRMNTYYTRNSLNNLILNNLLILNFLFQIVLS